MEKSLTFCIHPRVKRPRDVKKKKPVLFPSKFDERPIDQETYKIPRKNEGKKNIIKVHSIKLTKTSTKRKYLKIGHWFGDIMIKVTEGGVSLLNGENASQKTIQ